MAPRNSYFILWALSFLLHRSEQCIPRGALDLGGPCYVDPRFGTTLEYEFIVYETDDSVPGSCGDFSIGMHAVYTGADSVVTTEVSPDQVQLIAPGPQTMFFPFNKPYTDLLDGSKVSMTGEFMINDTLYATLPAAPFAIHLTSTIVYAISTSTVISVTELPSTSISVVTVPTTSTKTPAPVTKATGTATKTSLKPGKTTTKIVTITPAPHTINKTKVITKTVTQTCISAPAKPKRDASPLFNRGQPAGAPEVPYCKATGGPPITTVVTSTSLATATATSYDVSISLVTVTSTKVVTASTPTVFSGALTTTTITKTKPVVTSTVFYLANRQTKYVTKTTTISKTVLPLGKKTPPCTKKAVPVNGKQAKITGLGKR